MVRKVTQVPGGQSFIVYAYVLYGVLTGHVTSSPITVYLNPPLLLMLHFSCTGQQGASLPPKDPGLWVHFLCVPTVTKEEMVTVACTGSLSAFQEMACAISVHVASAKSNHMAVPHRKETGKHNSPMFPEGSREQKYLQTALRRTKKRFIRRKK